MKNFRVFVIETVADLMNERTVLHQKTDFRKLPFRLLVNPTD
ncbi:Hypothetical protein Eab7_2604 [Exiguobacterium antarcticum B7]|nr:Hypothetical protein Eab7_2604 [Exiguobacterium antarcticum B7]